MLIDRLLLFGVKATLKRVAVKFDPSIHWLNELETISDSADTKGTRSVVKATASHDLDNLMAAVLYMRGWARSWECFAALKSLNRRLSSS